MKSLIATLLLTSSAAFAQEIPANFALQQTAGKVDLAGTGRDFWVHQESDASVGGIYHTYDQFRYFDQLGVARKIHIYLPPKVIANPTQKVGLVIALDGQNVFFDTGRGSWEIPKAISELSAATGKTYIGVAIHPVNRNVEYSHGPMTQQQYDAWEAARRRGEVVHPVDYGGLANFANFVANDLVKFMSEHYPISSNPYDRAVTGASLGGLAAFAIAGLYPDAIRSVIAESPSVQVGLGGADSVASHPGSVWQLVEKNFELLESRGEKFRIHFACAQSGEEWNVIGTRLQPFAKFLTTTLSYNDHDLELIIDPNGQHNEATWRRRFPQALQWISR